MKQRKNKLKNKNSISWCEITPTGLVIIEIPQQRGGAEK